MEIIVLNHVWRINDGLRWLPGADEVRSWLTLHSVSFQRHPAYNDYDTYFLEDDLAVLFKLRFG